MQIALITLSLADPVGKTGHSAADQPDREGRSPMKQDSSSRLAALSTVKRSVLLARRSSIAVLVCTAAIGASAPALADSGDGSRSRHGEPAMEEIVVTASGFEQKVTDAPASISLVSGEYLRQRPYLT